MSDEFSPALAQILKGRIEKYHDIERSIERIVSTSAAPVHWDVKPDDYDMSQWNLTSVHYVSIEETKVRFKGMFSAKVAPAATVQVWGTVDIDVVWDHLPERWS